MLVNVALLLMTLWAWARLLCFLLVWLPAVLVAAIVVSGTDSCKTNVFLQALNSGPRAEGATDVIVV